MKPFLWVVVALLLGQTSAAARAADSNYTVTDIGVLAWVSDEAVSPRLSASGEISWWQAAPNKSLHAYTWQAGEAQAIGALPGYISSIASGLNIHGDVIGWSVAGSNLVDSNAATHAFFFREGRMQDLGTLGGRDSKALGINDAGDVVGWSAMPDSSHHAFLFRGGKLRDLGALGGASFSAAYAIDAAGVIVVGAAETAGHQVHAVAWKQDVIADLGTLPGGLRSRALALNDRGDIAGFSEAEGAETHGFLYADGRMQDLGDLGQDPVRPTAINNRRQIVGASGVNGFVRHAFLWQDGKMVDLNQLVPRDLGWRIADATDIDEKGRILCVAFHPETPGERHLLLLRPAGEPVTSVE